MEEELLHKELETILEIQVIHLYFHQLYLQEVEEVEDIDLQVLLEDLEVEEVDQDQEVDL
ncbi:MAG: hypothetical protein EB039_10160 [Proteobacteria bacterium]|nr:hypothetical protein [Pseudomonadota bacterium]